VNNLNAFYNQKVFIVSDKQNIQKQTKSYVIIAIVLYIVIAITIMGFLYFAQKYTHYKDERQKKYDDIYFYVMLVVFTIILMFVIAIGMAVQNRIEIITDSTRKVVFDETIGAGLSHLTMVTDIAPAFFKSDFTKKRLNLKALPLDRLFFKRFDANATTYVEERLVMYSQVANDIAVEFPGDKLAAAQLALQKGLLRVPPFGVGDWKPVRMLRSVQQIDPIGQLNRINDTITYFNGIIKKNYNTANVLTEETKQIIIDRIISIFQHAGALTTQFVAHNSVDRYSIKEQVESASDCQQKCMANPATGLSYYDSQSKMCYLIDAQNAQKTPFIFAGENSLNTNEVYVKPVGYDIYIASGKTQFPDLPNLASETYKTNVTDSVLAVNQIGKIDAMNSNNISNTSEVYESIENPANYASIFEGSTLSDALQAQNSRHLIAMKADSDSILHNIVSKNANFLNENRKNYLDTIVKELNKYDPSSTFQMDALTIEKILTGIFAGENKVIDQNQKGTITDILNEVPLRRVVLQDRKANMGIKTGLEDNTNIHQYISVEEFSMNMTKMSQENFVYKFLFHAYELFSTSQGLYKLYKFYDVSKKVTQKTALILTLLFICIMICSLILLIYNISMELLQEQMQKFSEKKRELERSDDGKSTTRTGEFAEILIRFLLKWFSIVCIITVILVMLWAYKTRLQKLHDYNYSVLERNAVIVRDNSRQIFQIIIDNIRAGKFLPYSGNPSTDLVTIHSYDDVLLSLTIDPDLPVAIEGVDMYDLHKKLYEAIEAFNKCNALFLGNNVDMPFPTYEVTIYATILAMMLIILAVIYFQLKPIQVFDNIKRWNRMKIEMDNNIYPSTPDAVFCKEKGITGPTADLVVKVVTLALVPIATILFATNMLSGANNLSSALYGSALYRNNECYDL